MRARARVGMAICAVAFHCAAIATFVGCGSDEGAGADAGGAPLLDATTTDDGAGSGGDSGSNGNADSGGGGNVDGTTGSDAAPSDGGGGAVDGGEDGPYSYTYYTSNTNTCPAPASKPGTIDAGEACAQADECKAICCMCAAGGKSYEGHVCQTTCLNAASTCSLVLGNVPSLCN